MEVDGFECPMSILFFLLDDQDRAMKLDIVWKNSNDDKLTAIRKYQPINYFTFIKAKPSQIGEFCTDICMVQMRDTCNWALTIGHWVFSPRSILPTYLTKKILLSIQKTWKIRLDHPQITWLKMKVEEFIETDKSFFQQ